MRTMSTSHALGIGRTTTLASLLALPATWITRARQRRQLMGLLGQSQHMLQDLGLQRDQISREALKPFWKK